MKQEVTAFELAQRFLGLREYKEGDNPHIMAMLRLDAEWPGGDEVPWCSAFVNYICWLLGLPRTKSLTARSWLKMGNVVPIDEAEVGYDIAILKRGPDPQPGSNIIRGTGHVGFYAGRMGNLIQILGGNQTDAVTIGKYDIARVLGIRRLYE